MSITLILFISGMTAVSAACLTPAAWLPPLPNDKLMHFLAFAGLGILAGRIAATKMELALWLLGLFIAGWAIEGLQSWVPGRHFCWRDIAANAAGIVTAIVSARVIIGI